MVSFIPVLPFVFLLVTTFYHLGEASRFIVVGGSLDGWKVPEPSKNNTLNHWAESVRFQVGDTLVFYVDAKKNDSVLEVTKENYESCNTEKPLKDYKVGEAKVKLPASGPYYFISGASTGNCGKGEKLIVVVQSPNHHHPVPKAPTPAAAPPTPSPKPSASPATPPKAPATPPSAPATPPSAPATPPTTPTTPATAPAPAPAKNTAVGLVAANGIFWASTLVIVIGLALA